MSRLFQLILIICLFSHTAYAQKAKAKQEKIVLKGFSYTISNKSSYSHDDDLNIEYFIIRNSTKPGRQNSAIALATRNDTTFMKGSYIIDKDSLKFKVCYYYRYSQGQYSSDSSETVFSPGKAGHLLLKKTIYYRMDKETEYNF